MVAASAANACVMYRCVEAGRLQTFAEEKTIASALAGGIRYDNRFSFPLVRQLVDEHVLVSEPEIEDAMRFAASEHNIIVEGGGAVALAASLHDKFRGSQGDTALIVSGGNLDPGLWTKIISR